MRERRISKPITSFLVFLMCFSQSVFSAPVPLTEADIRQLEQQVVSSSTIVCCISSEDIRAGDGGVPWGTVVFVILVVAVSAAYFKDGGTAEDFGL